MQITLLTCYPSSAKWSWVKSFPPDQWPIHSVFVGHASKDLESQCTDIGMSGYSVCSILVLIWSIDYAELLYAGLCSKLSRQVGKVYYIHQLLIVSGRPCERKVPKVCTKDSFLYGCELAPIQSSRFSFTSSFEKPLAYDLFKQNY